MELEQSQLDALRDAAGQMSAKMRAVRIVAASSVSREDLEHRLIQKGENKEQAREAVLWMEELSLVDDRETARQIVRRGAAKGYGRARVKQMLYEKRIPKELWDEALEESPAYPRLGSAGFETCDGCAFAPGTYLFGCPAGAAAATDGYGRFSGGTVDGKYRIHIVGVCQKPGGL